MDIVIYIAEPEQCPETHPFAYSDGKYCCKYGLEKVYSPNGESCDGGPISLSSSCCQDDLYTDCLSELCKNRGRSCI